MVRFVSVLCVTLTRRSADIEQTYVTIEVIIIGQYCQNCYFIHSRVLSVPGNHCIFRTSNMINRLHGLTFFWCTDRITIWVDNEKMYVIKNMTKVLSICQKNDPIYLVYIKLEEGE